MSENFELASPCEDTVLTGKLSLPIKLTSSRFVGRSRNQLQIHRRKHEQSCIVVSSSQSHASRGVRLRACRALRRDRSSNCSEYGISRAQGVQTRTPACCWRSRDTNWGRGTGNSSPQELTHSPGIASAAIQDFIFKMQKCDPPFDPKGESALFKTETFGSVGRTAINYRIVDDSLNQKRLNASTLVRAVARQLLFKPKPPFWRQGPLTIKMEQHHDK